MNGWRKLQLKISAIIELQVTESRELLCWLRAIAEPTRLRLLALCAGQDLSVTDLAEALGQSEPRVSRHLRILTEAGLVERVRQGQWVHYRVARGTPAAGFAQGLLGQLDRSDSSLVRDRQRARSQGIAGAGAVAASRLGRELCAVLEAEMTPRPASVLFVGLEHPQLLEAAGQSGHCTVLVYSRRVAQAVRAAAEREQRMCRIAQAGGETLTPRDLARMGQPFDAVVVDQITRAGGVPEALLGAARALLPVGGRLWLFERYDSAALAGSARVIEHPIARLRRRLAAAGLECRRIRPIEADGQHVLAATAVPVQQSLAMGRAS